MARLIKSERGVLAGVCAGIAEFLGWPDRRVRALWVAGTLLTGLLPGVATYTIMAIIMPSAGDPRGNFRLDDFRQQ